MTLAGSRDGVRPLPVAIDGQLPAVAAHDAVVVAWQDDGSVAARLLRER